MANETPPYDMRNIWQNQAGENTNLSLDVILKKATRFRARLRRKNLFAYFVLAFVAVAFGWTTFEFRPTNLIMRSGGCLVVAGCFYGIYQIHAKRRSRNVPIQAAFTDCLMFYRAELDRLRDFYDAVWTRFLALIPGYLVFCLGFAIAYPKGAWRIAAIAVIALGLGFFGVWLQRWLGRKVQREIDMLNALNSGNS